MALLVTRQSPKLIVPATPKPREIKHLSDIDDQEVLRMQVPMVFFYKNNPSKEVRDPVDTIRNAVSKALVFYYPLAGRLVEGPNKKLMVDCNGEGVLFIEADANAEINQLGDSIYPPCPHLDELLYNVPGSDQIVGSPLLIFQVTRFACGGFSVAIRFNHTMWDGYGLALFLKALEDITRGSSTPSVLPVWSRDLLSARNPPDITCKHLEYEDTDNGNDILDATDYPGMDLKSFYFGPKEIRTLRNRLPTHLRNCSNFDLVTACLWRSRTTALEYDPDAIVGLSCVVDVRGKRYNMNLPLGYYGNAFGLPTVCSKAELLCKNPLGYAVELVGKAKNKMSPAYIRSVADFMVIKGRAKNATVRNFIVSDNTRLGLDNIDFGWGKPLYGGVARAGSTICFLVAYKHKDGEHGILETICLPSSVMARFQEELRKMTNDDPFEDLQRKKAGSLSRL